MSWTPGEDSPFILLHILVFDWQFNSENSARRRRETVIRGWLIGDYF